MRIYSKLACFIGGVLFGSVGIKLLSSKDAKKAYTHITAAGLRMKDSAMKTVATVQENAGDILASAKDINEKDVYKRQYWNSPPASPWRKQRKSCRFGCRPPETGETEYCP